MLKFYLNIQLFGEKEKSEESEDKSEEKNEEQNKSKSLDPQEVIDLKKNYVKKEELDEANNKYNELVKKVLEGGELPESENEDINLDERIKTLRNELYGKDSENLSNLDYAKKTLELRQAIIDKGGEDPFLPQGHNANGVLVDITEDDRNKANNLAECIQHCIDFAEGDSVLFTNELMRITNDAMPKSFKGR